MCDVTRAIQSSEIPALGRIAVREQLVAGADRHRRLDRRPARVVERRRRKPGTRRPSRGEASAKKPSEAAQGTHRVSVRPRLSELGKLLYSGPDATRKDTWKEKRAMELRPPTSFALSTVSLFLVAAVPAAAEDWTRFRGPDGLGVSREKGLPTTGRERVPATSRFTPREATPTSSTSSTPPSPRFATIRSRGNSRRSRLSRRSRRDSKVKTTRRRWWSTRRGGFSTGRIGAITASRSSRSIPQRERCGCSRSSRPEASGHETSTSTPPGPFFSPPISNRTTSSFFGSTRFPASSTQRATLSLSPDRPV